MKKLILISLVICNLAVYGQNKSLFVSGTIGLGFSADKTITDGSKTVNEKISYFSILPKVGFFLADNIAVGAAIGFSTTTTKEPDNDNDNKISTPTFTFGPIARYYYMPLEKTGIFGEFSALFGFGSVKNSVNNTTTSNSFSAMEIGITPGVVIYVTDNISTEISFGWVGFSQETLEIINDTKSRESGFNFGINTNFAVGITYNF